MTEGEALAAIRSDIKELRTTMQHCANQVVLANNRIGVVENRMNRYDSGAKRLVEDTNEVKSLLAVIQEQNAKQLLEMEIAKADRAATIRTVKWLAGAAAIALPALMWLIQHGAK